MGLVITGAPGTTSFVPPDMPAPGIGKPGVPMFCAINGGGITINETMSQMQTFERVGKKGRPFMDTSLCVMPSLRHGFDGVMAVKGRRTVAQCVCNVKEETAISDVD